MPRIQAASPCGGFGAGGLAFQLGCGSEGGSDDDDDVDHDLISVRFSEWHGKRAGSGNAVGGCILLDVSKEMQGGVDVVRAFWFSPAQTRARR